MDRAVYDRMAEIDRDHWWFVGRRRIVTELLRKHRPAERPLKILEVGCGTGSNIAMLQQFGQVDAIEPDDHARAFAAQRTGLAIKGGYLPDGVALEDGYYDLIVLFDVLEHIPADREALVALKAKLAPGGRIIVTVPAAPWLWSAHDVAHHHQRRYTERTLTDVFANAGFRISHRSHFNSLLFPLIVAVRGIGKLTGREGGDDATPPAPVNALLARLFGAERHMVTRAYLPFGISLAAVAVPVEEPRAA
ncbi:SAM-dependent methyltransferase [Sphingomonas oleivorans]|uniref:SAM-dependent methyltransferase n=1 Tax=Sphingomonas oleivorans TaxID=1735121 RepID=A0A2T5G2T6_9SPHN|nr:class I SAM-dependent methyltransferase [Sphingomonas oleivorans]PTQ13456.1 SAM-dependent methyltransferase [Sphingomonas oleivorans]